MSVANTDFSDHVEWFKREVAVPGTFATLFPDTTDDDLAAALVDGLYRAKIDGWFSTIDADPDTFLATTEMTMTGVALVVIYSGIKFIQNQIKDMATRQRYEAPGGLVADTERAPTVLTERLKELVVEKNAILAQAGNSRARAIRMQDGYAIRLGAMAPGERIQPPTLAELG